MAARSGENRSLYKPVRGLMRGLLVLTALNERPAGCWGIAALGARTALHHTTLKRILESLRTLGYVDFHTETGRYHLTANVNALSAGYRDNDLVASVGASLLPDLTKALRWPLVLSTPDGDAMLTRVETHSLSALAFHRTTFGVRFPMFETAMGRAYLAACPEGHRRALLRVWTGREAHKTTSIEDLEVRLNGNVTSGFGCNNIGWGPFKAFSAISAPIVLPDQVAGSLTLGFPSRVMDCRQAIREIGAPLMAAAATIADAACCVQLKSNRVL